MTIERPVLIWRDNKIPVSDHFDDPYFSLENGLNETRHVFLSGNDLPQRFCDGFHIAELGFGTGLNALTSLLEWRATGQSGILRFTSFEAYPMAPKDMIHAQRQFPELHPIIDEFAPLWDDLWSNGTLMREDFHLRVVIGDARETVTQTDFTADCWFLDGFSPAKNPQLWGQDLMHAVAAKTKTGGTVATYSAAGFVRRNLTDAGFNVHKIPGFGRKRHMTTATKGHMQNAK